MNDMPSSMTSSAERIAAARAFAIEAARLAANTRCNNVVLLDVSDVSPVTDFFILATGTSPRQMRTTCDDVTELARNRDFAPLSSAGYDRDTWMIVDYVDVVLHVFSHDARLYYDLDNLWGDARIVEWQDPD